MSEGTNRQQHIVIVGGGIIGCTLAYYLLSHPRPADSPKLQVTLIEASRDGIAQGASGKAGGLIAKWAYPKALAHLSFTEHERLAAALDGTARYGWRYVESASWTGRSQGDSPGARTRSSAAATVSLEKGLGLPQPGSPRPSTRGKRQLPADLTWVQEHLTDAYAPMADEGETAQVHPYLFTKTMFDLAREMGLVLIRGTVVSFAKRTAADTKLEHEVVYSDHWQTAPETEQGSPRRLQATHVVVAAGAWTSRLLPKLPLQATRAHSVVFRPTASTPRIAPYVLFTEISAVGGNAATASPEIYARPDNDVYACGEGDHNAPLPDSVDDVQVDEGACASIVESVLAIASEELKSAEVVTRQACYLPVVQRGGDGPMVGEVASMGPNFYVATGHTCWGICNAPGTARALTELILDGRMSCANLQKLQPGIYGL